MAAITSSSISLAVRYVTGLYSPGVRQGSKVKSSNQVQGWWGERKKLRFFKLWR